MVYLYDSFHNLYVRNVVQLSRKFYILELLPYISIGGTMLELKPMIHKFRMKDNYYCLDVNSGIIHVIDELIDRVLDIYDGTNRDAVHAALDAKEDAVELDEIMDELDELIKAEQLFAPMSTEFKLVVGEKPIVKALCLNIAHDCNLACKYCFASQGDYGGVKRELMSFDVAKRAVDFLIKMSGPRQHCEIDFFGGEPLLNWDVVKQTVEYIESIQEKHNKIFKLTLTTNGMLLTQDKIDYVNEHKMSLVLSLDGRESVHNAMRPVAGSGAESYKYIAKNLINAVKQRHGLEYYVRGTYTHKNLDFTKDVMAMSDLGFEHLSMEPVVGEEGDYVLREEDWPVLEKEYEKFRKVYQKRDKVKMYLAHGYKKRHCYDSETMETQEYKMGEHNGILLVYELPDTVKEKKTEAEAYAAVWDIMMELQKELPSSVVYYGQDFLQEEGKRFDEMGVFLPLEHFSDRLERHIEKADQIVYGK